jgi:hypothetical protein
MPPVVKIPLLGSTTKKSLLLSCKNFSAHKKTSDSLVTVG